ncbi:biopolymer transport protein ExbD [Roseibium hamelinense]|uniref:Biopolymer transport protein ExbD n=1 Tax=Roseibium hamelinense TaxID=150831 RepID=A0A562TB42_9HYPH|nr:biopolymer transporter ExbD [Roseibium hamelinense]MTI45529.1 biopolymer transporter ExbD [Roseibium hamelinense]TWI90096.1 biopolymer transport protein ExbD [Roseibium hamelinense]
MLKLKTTPKKTPPEATISLINVVFLMLIFFLVAGQLTPPEDPEVTLSQSEDAMPLPPPDALYARADGGLFYRDAPVTAQEYLRQLAKTGGTEMPKVRLAADQALAAADLLAHVDALYGAGAERVVVVTRKVVP